VVVVLVWLELDEGLVVNEVFAGEKEVKELVAVVLVANHRNRTDSSSRKTKQSEQKTKTSKRMMRSRNRNGVGRIYLRVKEDVHRCVEDVGEGREEAGVVVLKV
jgi:hypothetical protein